MRKLVVIEFLSLDGVMQAPGSPDEDVEGGFRHGGWQRPYADEVLLRSALRGMADTDAYLFGRRTYDILARHWPTAPSDDPFARHLNATPKYVVSTTLSSAAWQNSTVIRDDVVEAVIALKKRPGRSIAVLGSATLVQTLLIHDLVDEFLLTLSPIVLGSGKRLFGPLARPVELSLVDATTTGTGSVLLTYRPLRRSHADVAEGGREIREELRGE